jgi:hypothetical protein
MMVLMVGASMFIASGLFPSHQKEVQIQSATHSNNMVQWRGDFDTGDTSQWDLETAKKYSLTVRNGGPGHPTAGRFEVRDGDHPVDSGERAEADAPNWTDVREGDERWYIFSMMFDKHFPVPTSFCDPMQWHPARSNGSAADGSPPLNLQCGSDDKLSLEVGDDTLLPIGPLDRGVWHRYLFHVKFSKNPKVAFEEMFRDGKVVIPKTSPKKAPNMTTPRMYLKIGMYRDSDNDGPMVIWHDDLTIYTGPPPADATTIPTNTPTTPNTNGCSAN